MKYLGIDFGSKRVGIAVSDETNTLAFPRCVLENNKKLLEEVWKIAKEENAEKIILGESKNFRGEPNPIMREIEKFKKNLEEKFLKERFPAEIFFEPEFMTSSQAEHLQGKNRLHDASAAAIILQSFIDKN